MFTDLYLQTTNPNLPFSSLFTMQIMGGIILSVIFHTILYASFFNLTSYIFLGKMLSIAVNRRLIITLLLIMFFGYIGRLIITLLLIMFFGFFARFFHVKEIYRAYHNDMKKTRKHLDKLYIGWIFLS